ncbi:MAG TPA: AlkA N-terminal domain-containing protein [Caldilineaceae bacterium]|nr:AlkA N-terminal domain-containing protein [Caldilineaceae bacterium]
MNTHLLTDQCYCAIEQDDVRYDGLFFTAVLTTGIFCRPTCAAQTPRAENVRFFATAAAAAEAGFRPCLRCRPETAPEYPTSYTLSPLVSQGLQQIAAGVLDEHGVEELAQRLHVSSRQLRRLFVDELGAPPVAIAQTRRLLFAKQLIDETQLPMTDVAYSAGYTSLRRFNTAIYQTYGRTPSELRGSRYNRKYQRPDDWVQLRLYYRPPYHWRSMLRFLQQRAIPGVEEVAGLIYRRLHRVTDRQNERHQGIVEVEVLPDEAYLLVRVQPTLARWLLPITERVKQLFDLRADPMAIANHFADDEVLGRLVHGYPGVRVPGAWDGFETAVRLILGQQISVKAATTLAGKLMAAYGEPIGDTDQSNTDQPKIGGMLTRHFPTPQVLADADLAALGMTKRTAQTIQRFSRTLCDGSMTLQRAPSLEETLGQLTALPGIGAWTANCIAMRVMGEVDAFPAGDLILRRALSLDPKGAVSEAALLTHATAWQPFRAYAAMLLWTHYAEQTR